jgi:hypothetical protein
MDLALTLLRTFVTRSLPVASVSEIERGNSANQRKVLANRPKTKRTAAGLA